MIKRSASKDPSESTTGIPGHLLILEHDRKDWSHLVVVDTPDLDSVEPENRQIAEDLYLLSDAVVFVTSQEKYADEMPYQLLVKLLQEKKPYFFLLNKAQDRITKEEIIETLKGQGVSLKKERTWQVPYTPSRPFRWISEHSVFRDFAADLLQELSADRFDEFRETQFKRRTEDTKTRVIRLIHLMNLKPG